MMISRKKILSRSQSDMDYSSNYNAYQCDEDVWYHKDKLYNDHIQEIFKKWEQLDDEIWLKVICMERNRRIAKAYARVPLLTINGGTNGFDGYKIGVNGFDNPLEDHVIKRVKHSVGKGVRIKIDEMGSVIIKRLSTADIMIRGYDRESTALGKDVLEANGNLPAEQSVKLFDIKKFQQNITKELRNTYPNRQKLEAQCIIVIGFVKDSDNILEMPVWCMLINIVALDMLKSRLPAVLYRNNEFSNYATAGQPAPKFVSVFDKNGDRVQIADEDPYSVPSLPKMMSDNQGSGASNSSGSGSSGGGNGQSRNYDPYSLNQSGPMNGIYSTRIMAQQQSAHHLQYMQQQRMLQHANNSKNHQREKENNPTPPELPPRDFSKQNGTPKKTKTRNFAKVFRFRKSSDDRKKKGSSDEEKTPVDLNTTTTNEIEYEDPYYSGMQARVSNFGTKQRKSLAVAPVQGYINNLNNAQYMRKANSNGYLNSLFNSNGNSNFYPNPKVSYYSPQQYDSSFESDPYAISSNENADYYAIYGNRMHPNVYPGHQALGYRRSPQENYHHMPQTVFSKAERYADRYATEWD